MSPPQAATRPWRIGGIVRPIAAAAIAAALWVWTIPATSGRRAYVIVCSGSSDVGFRAPSTTRPSTRTITTSEARIVS